MIDCAVIGAGQAGLATSYHLSRLGVEHVVLERGRVGETWHVRWDSFHLNTPNWCTQLPGLDLSGMDPDAFAPRAEIVELLAGYAGRIAAPVETAEVTGLRASAGGFELELTDAALAARSVVVATGAFQQPLSFRATADTLREKLDDAGDATNELVTQLRSLGAPDLEAGDELQQQLDDSAEELESKYDALRDSAEEAADAPPAEFLQQLAGLASDFSALQTAISTTVSSLQDADVGEESKAELQQAFADAPSCQSLQAES
jgi:hypothetical protein